MKSTSTSFRFNVPVNSKAGDWAVSVVRWCLILGMPIVALFLSSSICYGLVTPSLDAYRLEELGDLRIGVMGIDNVPVMPYERTARSYLNKDELELLRTRCGQQDIDDLTPVQLAFLAAYLYQESDCSLLFEVCESLHKTHPDDLIAIRMYAIMLQLKSRQSEAEIQYNLLLNSPKSSEYLRACVANNLSAILVEKVRPAIAESYAAFAVDFARNNGFAYELANFLNNYALVAWYRNDTVAARTYQDEAISLAERLDFPRSNYLLLQSNSEYAKIQGCTSVPRLREALKFFSSLPDALSKERHIRLLAEIEDNSSYTNMQMARYSTNPISIKHYLTVAFEHASGSVQYHDEAGDALGAIRDTLRFAEILYLAHTTLSDIDSIAGHIPSEYVTLAKAGLEAAKREGFVSLRMDIMAFIARTLLDSKTPSEVQEARALLEEALALARETGLTRSKLELYPLLILSYSNSEDSTSLLEQTRYLVRTIVIQAGMAGCQSSDSSLAVLETKVAEAPASVAARMREQITDELKSPENQYLLEETASGSACRRRLTEVATQ